jgi:hypothetical protein
VRVLRCDLPLGERTAEGLHEQANLFTN